MKTLTLIRHAKSSWDDPFLDDFDRPLNPRGRHDLPLMCARMLAHGPAPDQLIHSTALRTHLTASALIDTFRLTDRAVCGTDRIYEADVSVLEALLRQQSNEHQHLMLVGHNPGLLLLAHWLCQQAPDRLPTAAIIQLELPLTYWRDLAPGCARTVWFDYPKLHRPLAPERDTLASS
ncbi:SixA phosphatase family protein [Marinobacterium marinum]|uniref:Histidine phosphatase family protein n=1 Tax=Marinobacterium marinum TaxID=2756129 RepID=A0A7W1WZV9_9GAMM|nr:histidine phosphatase family protein [Marinobacterium marinum]MBA4503194.1 histidine phosphatase family protein [Marinobacterium marinum]